MSLRTSSAKSSKICNLSSSISAQTRSNSVDARKNTERRGSSQRSASERFLQKRRDGWKDSSLNLHVLTNNTSHQKPAGRLRQRHMTAKTIIQKREEKTQLETQTESDWKHSLRPEFKDDSGGNTALHVDTSAPPTIRKAGDSLYVRHKLAEKDKKAKEEIERQKVWGNSLRSEFHDPDNAFKFDSESSTENKKQNKQELTIKERIKQREEFRKAKKQETVQLEQKWKEMLRGDLQTSTQTSFIVKDIAIKKFTITKPKKASEIKEIHRQKDEVKKAKKEEEKQLEKFWKGTLRENLQSANSTRSLSKQSVVAKRKTAAEIKAMHKEKDMRRLKQKEEWKAVQGEWLHSLRSDLQDQIFSGLEVDLTKQEEHSRRKGLSGKEYREFIEKRKQNEAELTQEWKDSLRPQLKK